MIGDVEDKGKAVAKDSRSQDDDVDVDEYAVVPTSAHILSEDANHEAD